MPTTSRRGEARCGADPLRPLFSSRVFDRRVHLTFVALVLVAASCRRSDRATPTMQPVPGLTVLDQWESGTQTPNVTTASGTVMMTWQQLEPPAVRWRQRAVDGRWGEPRTLVKSDDLFLNWADFPVMAAFDDHRFAAAWLRRSSEHAYGIELGHSTNAGAQWSTARLHAHTGGPEYGFVSMTPLADGRLRAYWLDGRESGGHEHGGAMQLRAATIAPDGVVDERALIDERVCDCCQTSAATTAAGPVVVYRDRSEAEVRDVAIAGPGKLRRKVAADGWTIAGCPVNGPAVAASEHGLVVAWFTGVGGEGKVQAAFATDEGEFSPGVSLGLSKPMGRVDVEWINADQALVSFIEQTDDGASLLARTIARNGHLGPAWRIADVSASNASGFPRMVRTKDTLVWAFTAETRDGPEVRVAEAPLAGLDR